MFQLPHVFNYTVVYCEYSKTCLKQPLSKSPKIGFKTDYRIMQFKSIAECSKESILQYFRPALSYHMALRPFFLFLSGRFRQVLLYVTWANPGDLMAIYKSLSFLLTIHFSLFLQ